METVPLSLASSLVALLGPLTDVLHHEEHPWVPLIRDVVDETQHRIAEAVGADAARESLAVAVEKLVERIDFDLWEE